MRFMPKMQTKLLWPIGLSSIESCPVFYQKKKKKQDNDFTDHIGMVYVDIEIEPSGSIWLTMIHDENQIEQRRDPL